MTQYAKSKAHNVHKRQVQEAYNFAVFVCHAAPHFEKLINDVESGMAALPVPVYFAPNQNDVPFFRIELATFERRLASYVFLSVFSYFESFVKDVVQEMIDFHGGAKSLIALAEARDKKLTMEFTANAAAAHKMKLRKFVKGKENKYKKFTAILDQEGFRFPTERFSAYGIRMLIERHKNMKASHIPAFLTEALHMSLDPKDVSRFDNFRDKRNKLAHGNAVMMNLKELGRATDLFRRWTFALNTHILENFVVIEKYAV